MHMWRAPNTLTAGFQGPNLRMLFPPKLTAIVSLKLLKIQHNGPSDILRKMAPTFSSHSGNPSFPGHQSTHFTLAEAVAQLADYSRAHLADSREL